ncbi:translocon-associated protein subunit delta [Hetaerina americana]|uniref:translocon-associated protein subunit delta n=1 Tax=Hetaerina americana TaxID=62018 RepID=UPI003A7F1373
MYKFQLGVSVIFVAFSFTFGKTCTNPEVSATAFTTQDATVLTSIAYVSEFTLQCSNGAEKDRLPLYAEVNGVTLPTARIGPEGYGRYQVSWTEEISSAHTGDVPVHLYDEDGYATLRKLLRNNEDTSNAKPLVTIVVNHPGAYQGPWVNSEFMAVMLAALVWYLAFTAKSKLLA